MNPKEIETVKKRVVYLGQERDKKKQVMLQLAQECKSIEGGIVELNLLLKNLTPEKKEGET